MRRSRCLNAAVGETGTPGRGTPLLHAALTLFGARRVDVKCGDSCISLHQKPGSFYMGNLCALSHNVVHDEHPTGTYGDEIYGSRRVQIAVMLRSDVFRAALTRKINAFPGPVELFNIVSRETAKHLAEQPLHLPDLAAVISEFTAASATFPSVAVATSAASSQ